MKMTVALLWRKTICLLASIICAQGENKYIQLSPTLPLPLPLSNKGELAYFSPQASLLPSMEATQTYSPSLDTAHFDNSQSFFNVNRNYSIILQPSATLPIQSTPTPTPTQTLSPLDYIALQKSNALTVNDFTTQQPSLFPSTVDQPNYLPVNPSPVLPIPTSHIPTPSIQGLSPSVEITDSERPYSILADSPTKQIYNSVNANGKFNSSIWHMPSIPNAASELPLVYQQVRKQRYSSSQEETSTTLSPSRGIIKIPPTTPTSDFRGIRGYRRFHANDSLIGQPILCTHEEKLCFQYNLLFNSQYEGCYGIGHTFFDRYTNMGDANEIVNGTKHLRGMRFADFCPGYRMAYDDVCYQKDLVSNYICGCDAEPTLHPYLGGFECRCTPPTPALVRQPTEEGKCRIPDLRFPETDRFHYFQNDSDAIRGFKVEGGRVRTTEAFPQFACSSEQAQCFSEGKVWSPEGKGCFPLLERGPCAEERVLALDARAAREGRAEGTCLHVRGGCPQGHVRMAFDELCHHASDVKISVAGNLARDQFGMFVAVPRLVFGLKFEQYNERINAFPDSNVCKMKVMPISITLSILPPIKPTCSTDDDIQCSRYKLSTEIPMPEVE